MEIKITTKKIACDLPGCDLIAKFEFDYKRSFLSSKMYVCDKCLGELYKNIGKHIVPASVKNVYKKNSEVKN